MRKSNFKLMSSGCKTALGVACANAYSIVTLCLSSAHSHSTLQKRKLLSRSVTVPPATEWLYQGLMQMETVGDPGNSYAYVLSSTSLLCHEIAHGTLPDYNYVSIATEQLNGIGKGLRKDSAVPGQRRNYPLVLLLLFISRDSDTPFRTLH